MKLSQSSVSKMKKVLVIDAQGGGLGKQIIAALKEQCRDIHITAVGTNSAATQGMLKAGADEGATGENSVVVCAQCADYIIGPVGIVIADSMLGEITPKMAQAVGSSPAKKLLIPMNQCSNIIIGYKKTPMADLMAEIAQVIEENTCS